MKLFEKEEENGKLLERLAKLESLPSTKEALESEKAEILATRKKAAAEILAIQGDTAGLSKLDRDIETMTAHLRQMDCRREGLATALNEKRAELMRAKLDRESDIRKNQEILFSSYPPEIDAAIEFFKERLDFLRRPGKISIQKAGGVLNLISWKKNTTAYSNAPAVQEATRYCQSAIRELEAMRLIPDPDTARIASLRKGVPDHTIMSEFTGERDAERTPPNPDIPTLGSEQLNDWNIKKLNQKFREVMRRPA